MVEGILIVTYNFSLCRYLMEDIMASSLHVINYEMHHTCNCSIVSVLGLGIATELILMYHIEQCGTKMTS